MLKGAMLTGKPVLAYNTNRELGHVQGTLIDYDANRLAAFWVNPGAPTYQTRILPWSGVKTVEADRVIAWSANMLANVRDLFSIQRLIVQKAIRPGMRFKTIDHQDLGAMADFYFDESTGLLEGYEIVEGVLAADTDNHGFLPAPPMMAISENEMLVPANTVKTMQEKPGGLLALLEQLKEEIEVGSPVNQDLIIRYLLPGINGLRVERSVQLNNGVIVAARGQIITAALIQRAQTHQAEQQMIEAVGIDLDALV